MQKTIADEAKLGNIVSTDRGWIIAQEELNVCDDWSNRNERKLNSSKSEVIYWVIINNTSAISWQVIP